MRFLNGILYSHRLQPSVVGLVGTTQSSLSARAKKDKLSVAENLFENGASIDRTTNNVLSLLVGASVELSQCACALPLYRHRLSSVFFPFFLAIINVVNFYLDQPDVVSQLRAADAKNHALEGYIYEAMRKCYIALSCHLCRCFSESDTGIDPPFRGVYRTPCTSLI